MREEDFWKMRVGTFFLKLLFFREAREREFRLHAEVTRMQTVILFNIQLARKDRITDPKKLWKFPWDGRTASAAALTEEEQAESEARLKKMVETLKTIGQ